MGSLKMVPSLFVPPPLVIPYRVEPLGLSVKLPYGCAPWVPSKLKRTVGVPPPAG